MPFSIQKLSCRVVRLEDVTPDVRIVRLEVADGGPFRFAAGQYASVTFHGQPPRDYSMGNGPDEPVLEFHIRHAGNHGASAHVAGELRVGDPVSVEGPFGDGWLRQDHSGPILAIAGGSGLAPIKSIVETALVAGMKQDVHLYFGVRDEPDIYLEQHFMALAERYPNLRFVPVLSEPGAPTDRRSGMVGDAVAADLADFDNVKAYIAGPPGMVAAAVEMLLERGMPAIDIHADAFYTVAEKEAVGRAMRQPI
jgi:CDP-4-dehydro-6-deoxyglucose reductase/ferredoxin-NAD(P)+ reductase (naphthalene dioxygenase ferredoxin-specific)